MTFIRVIDADGHVLEDEGIWNFIPSPIKGRGPKPVRANREGVLRFGNSLFPDLDHLKAGQGIHQNTHGGFNYVAAEEWVQFLDDVGIELTVLYPTHALSYGRINSGEWAGLVTKAYNDWLYASFLSKDPRLKGVGLIPLQDPEAAAEELTRIVEELGMFGAMLPATGGIRTNLGAKQYWPIYREADRLGCCLAVHGGCFGGMGFDDLNMYASSNALGHPLSLTISLTSMIANGVFDTFPNMRVAFLEGGVAWFLVVTERLVRGYSAFTPLSGVEPVLPLTGNETATDYLLRHVREGRIFVGCEGAEPALSTAIKLVGSDPFLFSSDFPHEVNNETCKKEIEELTENEDISEASKEAILYKNAQRFYRLT